MRKLATLLLLIACGGDDDVATDAGAVDAATTLDAGAEFQTHDELRVEADDGSATLVIAADSIPEGIVPSDISVTAIDTQLVASDGAELREYELLPDGVQFREPATLTVRGLWETTPLGILTNEESVEVAEVTNAVEDDEGITSVDMTVPHFTGAILAATVSLERIGADMREVRYQEITEVLIDASGPRITDVRIEGPLGSRSSPSNLRVRPTLVSTEVSYEMTAAERVSPASSTSIGAAALPARWEPTYRCETTGRMQVDYVAQVVVTIDVEVETGTFGSGEVTRSVRRGRQEFSASAQCLPDVSFADARRDCTETLGADEECTFFGDLIDIASDSVTHVDLPSERLEPTFYNTAYPCDSVSGDQVVVCPVAPGEFPEGAMWVATMTLGADVPEADPDHSLIYSVVFESDGVSENDWVVVDPFVWDYFQGTDRWYQLIWDHVARRWSVTVTQVDETQTQESVSSAVRVVLVGDTVTWFIPTSELPSATPAYRFSAFAHDGAFSRSDRGGDVSGVDPTVPPRVVDP